MKIRLIIGMLFLSIASYAQKTDFTVQDKKNLQELKSDVKDLGNRMTKVETRIDEFEKRLDSRFEQLDKRLEFIGNLIIALIVGMFGFAGYLAYHRVNSFKPIYKK